IEIGVLDAHIRTLQGGGDQPQTLEGHVAEHNHSHGLQSLASATWTWLRVCAYRDMPRYRASASFCRCSPRRNRDSSRELLRNAISARMDGIEAPIRTTKGAFFTPRFLIPE